MAQIGDFQLVDKIAEGGMATVYRGHQASLDRPVAIKVMSRVFADDADLVTRFDREALIIARLHHPNIIRVIDKGMTSAGNAYFVMEYVDGMDLACLNRTKKLDSHRKLDLIIQIAKALAYAHKNGVIHRDVKPQNVLVDAEGHAVVTDFGIARFRDSGTATAERTVVGAVFGTPAYMSPEQHSDASSVSAATDIYSLGVVAYQLFTSEKLDPAQGPVLLDRINLPEGLPAALRRCLDKEPARRPAAQELVASLLALSRGGHLAHQQREQAALDMVALKEKFALLDVIKQDRFSSVYLYERRSDGRLLVIKRLGRDSRGLETAKKLQGLQHPHIARLLGAAGSKKRYIVVMEYLAGGNLQDRLLRPMPLEEALRIMRALVDALVFAHDKELLHGNLRPSNLLFDDDDQLKLADFGLDEHYHERHPANNWYNRYCQNRSVSADMLAAGTIFYQMLCADLPGRREDFATQSGPLKRLPAGVQKFAQKLLAADDSRRYPDMKSVAAAMEKVARNPDADPDSKPVRKSRWRRWIAWALVSELLAGGAAIAATWESVDYPGLVSGWFVFLQNMLGG